MKEYIVLAAAEHTDNTYWDDIGLPKHKALDVNKRMISYRKDMMEKALNTMAGAGWELHTVIGELCIFVRDI